jgi:arylsulfatase A-like enzyme
VRADHTTPYGYARDTTPALARLAATSLVYERAYTSGGWTTLAIASLMRGRSPRQLDWRLLGETNRLRLVGEADALVPGERITTFFTLPIAESYPSLAQGLARRGYATYAVVDDGATEFFDPRHALAPGFAEYVLVEPPGDRAVSDAAIAVVRRVQGPFFLWCHYFGPHAPDETHDDVPRFGDTPTDRYDHELAHWDRQLDRLLRALDDLSGPVAVLVVSDHGEIIGQGIRGHGIDLFEGSVRIPFVLRAPGLAAGMRAGPVSLVDVMPTILALTGTPPPPGLEGVDLTGASVPEHRVLLTDLWRYDASGRRNFDLVSAGDGEHRLVLDLLQRASNLHTVDDPRRPPTDLRTVEAPLPAAAAKLSSALERYVGGGVP